jgi:ATP-dependent RNA helicase SUPV3L1/SUV3
LSPLVNLIADEHLKPEQRAAVQSRLDAWLRARLDARLAPLLALRDAVEAKVGTERALPAQARGVAHQLLENFGSLDRARAELPRELRILINALKDHGIWIGRRTVYFPKLLRPDCAGLLALLWSVWSRLEKLPPLPPPGVTSFDADSAVPEGFSAAAGFRVVARRAIRFDMLERLEDELERGARQGTGADNLRPKLVSLLGCSNETLDLVLRALRWSAIEVAASKQAASKVYRMEQGRRRVERRTSDRSVVENTSPFAELARLMTAK